MPEVVRREILRQVNERWFALYRDDRITGLFSS